MLFFYLIQMVNSTNRIGRESVSGFAECELGYGGRGFTLRIGLDLICKRNLCAILDRSNTQYPDYAQGGQ